MKQAKVFSGSIIPFLMFNRKYIKLFLYMPPFGHMIIHKSDKPFIVSRFNNMYHFMNKNKLQTLPGFLSQVSIQP